MFASRQHKSRKAHMFCRVDSCSNISRQLRVSLYEERLNHPRHSFSPSHSACSKSYSVKGCVFSTAAWPRNLHCLLINSRTKGEHSYRMIYPTMALFLILYIKHPHLEVIHSNRSSHLVTSTQTRPRVL